MVVLGPATEGHIDISLSFRGPNMYCMCVCRKPVAQQPEAVQYQSRLFKLTGTFFSYESEQSASSGEIRCVSGPRGLKSPLIR